jgi:hypothetical protein
MIMMIIIIMMRKITVAVEVKMNTGNYNYIQFFILHASVEAKCRNVVGLFLLLPFGA